jgi:hypothetical protein
MLRFYFALPVLGLVLVNILGLTFTNYFRFLIFLDTLGTAGAGMYFGQTNGVLWGALAGGGVGAATNLIIMQKLPAYRKFVHVNILCGVAWGMIAGLLPVPSLGTPEAQVLIYILGAGFVVGFASALLAVPVRIWSNFNSNHLLDDVSRPIWRDDSKSKGKRALSVFTTETLLSHFPDKILSTTAAVMCLLAIAAASSTNNMTVMYRELLDLLGAYYFLALAYVVKSLGVQIKEPLLLLLGPLGLFSVLMAVPVVLRLISGS